jgi:hypothetical protein
MRPQKEQNSRRKEDEISQSANRKRRYPVLHAIELKKQEGAHRSRAEEYPSMAIPLKQHQPCDCANCAERRGEESNGALP